MSNPNIKPLQLVQIGKEASLYIYGDLAAFRIFDEDTSPYSLRQELKQLEAAGVQDIHVHIDSYGGDISAGWAIYNTLKDWPGRVTSYADGYVASAAVYPFLAGSVRVANPMSAFFLHQAWGARSGNADQLRKAADELDIINDLGLEAFAAAGMDKDRIKDMEQKETWIKPQEALEMGLATEIQDRSDEATPQQSVRAQILQLLFGGQTENERRQALGLEPIQEPEGLRMQLTSEGGAQSAAQRGQGAQAAQEAAKGDTGAETLEKQETGGAGGQRGLAAFFARLAGNNQK